VRIRTMLYTKREVTNSFPHPMLICRCAFSCNVLTGDIHIVGLLEEIKQQMKMHSALLSTFHTSPTNIGDDFWTGGSRSATSYAYHSNFDRRRVCPHWTMPKWPGCQDTTGIYLWLTSTIWIWVLVVKLILTNNLFVKFIYATFAVDFYLGHLNGFI